MTQRRLNIYTVIAFGLIPLIFLVGGFWKEPLYVYKEVDLASLLALTSGIYIALVGVFHLVHAFREWRDMTGNWKKSLTFIYLIVFLIAAGSPVFLTWNGIFPIFKTNDSYYDFTSIAFITFLALSFLFVMGFSSIVIGCIALKYRHGRSKAYLVVTMICGAIFSLVGILPAVMVFFYFFHGPGSIVPPCYCPVNRRSGPKDFLLKPLYNYRKKQLRGRLCFAKKLT